MNLAWVASNSDPLFSDKVLSRYERNLLYLHFGQGRNWKRIAKICRKTIQIVREDYAGGSAVFVWGRGGKPKEATCHALARSIRIIAPGLTSSRSTSIGLEPNSFSIPCKTAI